MTFFTFDDDDCNADTRDVLKASAELEITEFRLFELAHRRWFGECGSERHIEELFTPYMYGGPAPHWVRQFCREVLERAGAGELDPLEFGVHPLPETDTMVRRGLRYTMLVVFLVTALHLVAILVSGYTGYGSESKAAPSPATPVKLGVEYPRVP